MRIKYWMPDFPKDLPPGEYSFTCNDAIELTRPDGEEILLLELVDVKEIEE